MTAFDISPERFRLKKFARRAAVTVGRAIGPPGVPGDGSIRVLTYHRFGDSPLDACCLHPREFDAQLAWLSDHANILTPEGFVAAMSGANPAPDGSLLLTIDDGHRSVATHALPAMDRYGIKAVLFVCPKFVTSAETSVSDPDHRFMDWDELARAGTGGHAVAPHGYTHLSLGRMPIADAVAEIDRARAALESRLGVRTPFFSFPFGTPADYSQQLAEALVERAFHHCFTAVHGRCIPGSGSVLLPRVKVEGGNESDLFPDIVRGCIDNWRIVDHTLYRFQQRGRM